MTATSIIKVDVDPEGKLKSFYELFAKYQKQLEEMPEDWGKVTEGIEDAGDGMGNFAKMSQSSKDFLMIAAVQANAIAKAINSANDSHKKLNDRVKEGSLSFSKMAKSAKTVSDSILDASKTLLKLGAIGGGIAGIGGVLGALTLDGLASSAVGTQRAARGLGMTPGQLRAFNVDFGDRYLDPSMLGKVADAQNSFTGRMWLARASGLGMNQVSQMDPGSVAARLAVRAHDWWANTPESMRTAEVLQSTGFQQFFSMNEMRQQGRTPRSELMRAAGQYDTDQNSLNVGDGTTDAWYGFKRQLDLAGQAIETHLTNKLSTLAPDLERFSKVFTEDAGKLIDDILTPENLQAIENGIDGLAKYLGSPRALQDMQNISAGLGVLARALAKIGVLVGDGPKPPPPDIPLGLDPDEVQRETHGQLTGFTGITPDKAYAAAQNAADAQMGRGLDYLRHSLTMPWRPDAALSSLEQSNGLPPGILSALRSIESTNGSNLVGPVLANGDQAIGDFQFTSDTWREWGKGGDRWSFNDESKAAARYLTYLMKHYKGDIRKALAAWNWGMGNVDKDIAGTEKSGKNWEGGLPGDVRTFVSKVLAQQNKNVNITVSNSTPSRVDYSMNAAPY
jgi:hypothetical protein